MQKNLPDKTSTTPHHHQASPCFKFPSPKPEAKIKINIVSSSRSITIHAILRGLTFYKNETANMRYPHPENFLTIFQIAIGSIQMQESSRLPAIIENIPLLLKSIPV